MVLSFQNAKIDPSTPTFGLTDTDLSNSVAALWNFFSGV